MSQSTSYAALSQTELGDGKENKQNSLAETSDEFTSSSQDSLDLVLLEIGNKRKVRRKKRRKMGGIQKFDGAESYEELIGSAKKRRQFYILGGLCALAIVVIVAIVLSVVLIRRNDDPKDERLALNLEDILLGRLQPRRFNGTWVDDNNFYFFDDKGNFLLHDVSQKKTEVIVERNELFIEASSYEFSFDKKFILTASATIKIFRHSFLAKWDVYDILSKTFIPIKIGDATHFSLVKMSPVDQSMIIVFGNNIYYKRTPTEPEIQITTDGSHQIYNGVPDWVNEEEVFETNEAIWFSPNGQKIAFIRFDDDGVPIMALPIYGGVGDPDYVYPKAYPVNYPKVNAKNPSVKLFYVDLSVVTSPATVSLIEVPVPTRFVTPENDHLVTSVAWATNTDLIAVFMNRVQSKGEIQKCMTTGAVVCGQALDLDVTNAWIDVFHSVFFNKDGNRMIFMGSFEGYRQVMSLDLNTVGATAARSAGKFVVTDILAFNKEKNLILFTANTEEDSKAQHIYAVKDEANAVKVCLTCEPKSGYTYFGAEVSKDGNNIVISASGPNVPQTHLYSINVDGATIALKNHVEIQSNENLKKTIDGKKLPRIMYHNVTLENGSVSQVMMSVPSDLSEDKKYPMIVDVYGGPDSSSVTNRWAIDWGTYMVSAHDTIYARIDGRGSGLRGDVNLHALYRKLGTVEVEDQLETVQKLHQQFKYIDADRSAIWGWSYGGYVSGMALMTDTKNIFKCAVSVAPVTDWNLYDSIYTERYMGLPTATDNAAAYAKARMMNYVANIATNNKTYMLVHGTLDDNVHFQQGMLLARTMERADIQFKEISYPDEDHSLSNVRPHLYHSLELFFKGCFDDSN